MEFFRIKRDIPFMRHALVLNAISFITFAAAVFFLIPVVLGVLQTPSMDKPDLMQAALVTTLATPDVVSRIATMGAVAVSTTPDEYRKLMQQESAKWGALVKKAKITLD